MQNVFKKEFFFSFSICLDVPQSTEHKTASLADEGNSAYCQSSGAHTLKTYKPMEINIERSPQHGARTRNFSLMRTTP